MSEPQTTRNRATSPIRFGLRSLLLIVTMAALVAATWAWWLRSPVRTAEQFVDFVHAGDFSAAGEMLTGNARITTVSGVGLPTYAGAGSIVFSTSTGAGGCSMDPRYVKQLFAKLQDYPLHKKLADGQCRFHAYHLVFAAADGKITVSIDVGAKPDVE